MSDSSTAPTNKAPSTDLSGKALPHVADIDNIWLLPDGVSDLLSDEAQKQELLRYKLTQILVKRGYVLTCPPMIEFTESLLGNASEDLKRQTFKIIDQLSGRLMGVRADITPQILRIDAHLTKLGKAPAISRYCYAGHVIRTLPDGLFGSRTPLQLGAEIFGCDSLDADIELIDVLYQLIDTIDLKKQLHLDIGHVAIFARLKALAQISEAEATGLISLYANKALPELKSRCQTLPMGDDFYQLAVYGHDMAILKLKLSDVAKNDAGILTAIDEVQTIVAHIKDVHHGNVSVDVTELGYHYHTGLVFNGYFENESQPVVRGGRFNGRSIEDTKPESYDPIFNDTMPSRVATGFSVQVTRLQRHISLAAVDLVLVNYDDLITVIGNSEDALQNKLTLKITELRNLGYSVVRPLSAADLPNGMTHQLVLEQDNWVLELV